MYRKCIRVTRWPEIQKLKDIIGKLDARHRQGKEGQDPDHGFSYALGAREKRHAGISGCSRAKCRIHHYSSLDSEPDSVADSPRSRSASVVSFVGRAEARSAGVSWSTSSKAGAPVLKAASKAPQSPQEEERRKLDRRLKPKTDPRSVFFRLVSNRSRQVERRGGDVSGRSNSGPGLVPREASWRPRSQPADARNLDSTRTTAKLGG